MIEIDSGTNWQTNIDKHILFLLQELHSNTTTKGRVGISSFLTEDIPINGEVKLRYVLEPLFLNLYLSNEEVVRARLISTLLHNWDHFTSPSEGGKYNIPSLGCRLKCYTHGNSICLVHQENTCKTGVWNLKFVVVYSDIFIYNSVGRKTFI